MRFLLLLLFLALPAGPASAQVSRAVRHFDDGNLHYRQGDYRGALEAYEAAVDLGYASGPLFYNMGNAHYRLDELGQAIAYYERARALMPEQPELLHNLEIAQSHTADTFSQLPEPFWRPAWRGIVRAFGVAGLFFGGLALYLVAIALIGHRLWTGTRHAWHRRARTFTLAGGLLLIGLAFAASIDHTHSRRAVVVASETSLYNTPAPGADAELDVHEGLLLDVLSAQDAWLQVRLPNGTTGWLDADTVTFI